MSKMQRDKVRYFRPIVIDDKIAASFHRKTAHEPNGCIRWTAALSNNGYGRIGWSRNGVSVVVQAHRVAWVIANGPITNGLVLDHLCRNKWCVNVAHMALVDSRGNNMTNPRSGFLLNAAKTHCKYGHPFSGYNLIVTKYGRRCRACHNAATLRDYHNGRTSTTKRKGRGAGSSAQA